MPPNATAAALTDGYRARLGGLRDATTDAVLALLERVDLDLGRPALARALAAWQERATLLVQASGGQAASDSARYLLAYLAAAGVDAVGAAEPVDADASGLAGVPPSLFWRLGQSAGRGQAMATASSVAQLYARTAISDAARQTLASGIAGEPGVSGWRRVTGAACCSRCAVLASRVYADRADFERHPADRCTQEPVLRDVPETVTRRAPTVVGP